jgi:hypothetical protein
MSARAARLVLALVLGLVPCSGCTATPESPPTPTPGAGPGPERTLHPTLEMFRPLLHRTVEEARHYLAQHVVRGPTLDVPGQRIVDVRPVIVDGEDQPGTEDVRLDRVNVELEQGRIVDVFQPG